MEKGLEKMTQKVLTLKMRHIGQNIFGILKLCKKYKWMKSLVVNST